MESISADKIGSTPRFGLKSLFLLVTAAAALLAPVSWFGFNYFVNAALSVALVIVCVLAYGEAKRASVIVVAIVGVFVGFIIAIGAIVFFLHALLNVLMCLTLAPAKPSRRTFASAIAIVMIGVYSFSFIQATAKIRELQALQDRFPFESLEPRLAFEEKSISNDVDGQQPIQLAADVNSNLVEQDERMQADYYSRAWALRELHDNAYTHFARAAGFGFMRMPTLSEGFVDWKFTPIKLPAAISISNRSTPTSELEGLHGEAVVCFASPDSNGYVRTRKAVAGFKPHLVTEINWYNTCGFVDAEHWQIVRLELVGLLRHDEPRVYVGTTATQMDQLAEAPHRTLNDFEKNALPKLETQNDIILDDQPNRILMLGAVRAGNSCLECHDGERGRLLGAFSYELTPAPEEDSASAELAQDNFDKELAN